MSLPYRTQGGTQSYSDKPAGTAKLMQSLSQAESSETEAASANPSPVPKPTSVVWCLMCYRSETFLLSLPGECPTYPARPYFSITWSLRPLTCGPPQPPRLPQLSRISAPLILKILLRMFRCFPICLSLDYQLQGAKLWIMCPPSCLAQPDSVNVTKRNGTHLCFFHNS